MHRISQRFIVPFFLLCIYAYTNPYGGFSQTTSSEYQLKGAVLFNFAKFIEWPENNTKNLDGSFYLCIIGESPFGNFFEETPERSIRGKRFSIKYINEYSNLKSCRILYVSPLWKGDLSRLIKNTGTLPILTVGENPNFVEAGGMIRLFVRENKIRFEINPTVANKSNLKISSHLLKISKIHEGGI